MSQPSIPQGELYVLLKIIYRHPLCVKNVFQIYCWFFFWFFFLCFFLSKLICIYLFDNINCSHLSNQVNCDCFKSTKEILCLLKETNSSSDFSKVLIYCICSKFSLKCSMRKSICSHSYFHGECIDFKSFVTVIHCVTHTTRCFHYRYTNEIQNSNKVLS